MLNMKINECKYKNRYYVHFDKKIDFVDGKLPLYIKQNIESSSWVKSHGFYPFVKYPKHNYKYNKDKTVNPKTKDKTVKKVTPKTRDLMYCSHIDRFIYQYYAHIINTCYNKVTSSLGIDDVAVAYRSYDSKPSNSNITLAEEVFNYISKQKSCLIFVTDFKNFFDKIDHEILKEQLSYTLGVERLEKDYFNVFQSITKYCYVNYIDVFSYLKLKNPSLKLNSFKNQNCFFEDTLDSKEKPIKIFKNFKKSLNSNNKKNLKVNLNSFGIPQGSPISAVLSNVYLIDFDSCISKFVNDMNGLYRRYCDDVIIVIPLEFSDEITKIIRELQNIIKICIKVNDKNLLKLNIKKTEYFLFDHGNLSKVKNMEILKQNNIFIDYLGFTFDGKHIRIREKSITNYYNKLHKKINQLNKLTIKYDRIVYRRKFYKQFSHLGSRERKNNLKHYQRFGNYISYAQKAHLVFKDKSKINKQIKAHWKIIHKSLLNKK